MAAASNNKKAQAVETEAEGVEQAGGRADEAEVEATQEPEVEEEQPRRKSKARAPARSATPFRERLRKKSSAGSTEGRRPAQRSLFSMMTPEIMSQRAAKVGGGLILFVGLLGALIVGFQFFAGSRFFKLRGIDVEGNKLLSAKEIETWVESNVDNGVLNAKLEKIRKDLEGRPLIRSAQVIKLLPDRLRVRITERTPIAVARLANESTACVDENGAIFGDLNTWRGKIMPPIIRGLAESGERKDEINRQWIEIYRRLIADLDQNEPRLSSRVDEVIFDSDQGVRLRLADSSVIVLVGRTDFRTRLNAALDVIDAVKRRDAAALNVLRIGDAERLLSGVEIKYLNVTDPNRVVVGLNE